MLQCKLVDLSVDQTLDRIPGNMWYCPWYWDPEKDQSNRRPFQESGFLSIHYWRDWAMKRPPICVRTPDSYLWLVDQVSSNGTGWVVTGEAPFITCSPSIVVPGYHGFLQNGVFTPDLEGRRYPINSAQ